MKRKIGTPEKKDTGYWRIDRVTYEDGSSFRENVLCVDENDHSGLGRYGGITGHTLSMNMLFKVEREHLIA